MNSSLGFVSSSVSTFHGNAAHLRSTVCPTRATSNVAVRMMADDPNKGKNPLSGLGLGNIMDAMKKAQQFTTVAKDLQEQLKNTEIETSVRDGQVTVIVNAQSVPIKVAVSEELVAKGADEVSAAVTEAVIAAHQKSSEYMKEKMANLTKDGSQRLHDSIELFHYHTDSEDDEVAFLISADILPSIHPFISRIKPLGSQQGKRENVLRDFDGEFQGLQEE